VTDELVIEVTDNGTGLALDQMARIFEPFFQGERKLHDAIGGLGIGLSLVRSLCELHGGHVEAYSAGPGTGSTFTVHLPLTTGPAPVADNTPTRTSERVQNILVVDDNADAADVLAEILRASGHRVHVAHTPEDGLALFQNNLIDLAILDIGLPNITGHELAELMRETGVNPRVRFVALSGFGQETDKERSAAAGFEVHFVKPIALEALHALLSSARN
jgi:CheY-like chemotaxis protein